MKESKMGLGDRLDTKTDTETNPIKPEEGEVTSVLSESEEAANARANLLGAAGDEVLPVGAMEEAFVTDAEVLLEEGQVRFFSKYGHALSTILASGDPIEFPVVTEDKKLIKELTAYAKHCGQVDITTFADTQTASV